MPGMLHPTIEIIRSSTNAIERIIRSLDKLGINTIVEHSPPSEANPSGGLSYITKVVQTADISFMYELYVGDHGDEYGYGILLEISPDLLKTLTNFLARNDNENSEDDGDVDFQTIDVYLYWKINPEKPDRTKGSLHVDTDDFENLAGQWLRSLFNMNRRSYASAQESIPSEERLFELIEQLLTAIAPHIKQAQEKQSA